MPLPQDFTARSAVSALLRPASAIAAALVLSAIAPPAASAANPATSQAAIVRDRDVDAPGALRVGSVKNLKDEASELPIDPDLLDPETSPVDLAPNSPAPDAPAPFQRKVETRVQLDLSDRKLYVYADDDSPIATYDVAIGKEGWETPVGEFSVTHMALDPIWENPWTGELIYPGPNNPMGRAVIVFHTVGDAMIAFHGTPNEELIGEAVSHGCVRMRNEDILAMYEIVRFGTAVSVVP
ncbi:MAG: L,D-transpeptidase [Geitlerinemataceae cyanobacterium]